MRLCPSPRVVVFCAAGLILAACSHVPSRHHHAEQPAPTPPSAAALKLQGDYDLSRYDGQPLPASVRRQGQCVVRVTSAVLHLHKGRFKLDESLSKHCQGELRSRTLKRAHGTVQLHNDRITLEASNRALFVRARGRLRGKGLVLTEVREKGRGRKVKWQFQRHSSGTGNSASQSGS